LRYSGSMNLFLKILIFCLLGLALLIGLNWSKIQRLKRVNSLFEADNIVHNFSNMRDALYSHDLPARGTAHVWPKTLKPLPAQVMIAGESRSLQAFLDETATTAFLVIKDGEILFENYYQGTTQDDQRISWSMAKSFLSALVGIAVEDGRIESLGDPVTKYVPSLKGSAYDGSTIGNVLNMASGVKFNEDYIDPKSDINKMGRTLALGSSMDKFAEGLDTREYEPGTVRQYVSIDTHVIGMVLRAVTNQSNHDFFIDNLWSKIGPGKDAYYLTDGKGVAFVLGGLNMRTRDYALFGQLFLQDGVWGGEQIIPKPWVAESTKNNAPSDNATDKSGFGYGYQWWVPPGSTEHGHDFQAGGIYGQFIYVNREANIVIVKNSANRNFREPAKSGNSYKRESVDVFRAIAEHYSNM